MQAAQHLAIESDSETLERLGVEISMLVRDQAAPRRRSVVEPPPDGAVPVFLPLCGTEVSIAVGDKLAVLNFQGVQDGRAFLIPIEIETLQHLGQAVANALLLSMEKSAGRGL
jgi:hypothetical protein